MAKVKQVSLFPGFGLKDVKGKILHADCLECMKSIEDNSIDLIVTSPPYVMRRKDTYGGITPEEYPDWIYQVGEEIFRILKPTGNFVLNINDTVEKGLRTTYVYEAVNKLSKLFRWTDTFIWAKANPFPTGTKRRLKDGFEYCYWFTKTKDYKFFPDAMLVPSTSKYLESEKRRKNKGEHRTSNGSGMDMSKRYISDMVRPSNVITLPTDTTNHVHPAAFPLSLPTFFIKLMSEPGDVVFDPFMGGGTTLLAARQEGRNYIGCDIVKEYVDATKERLEII